MKVAIIPQIESITLSDSEETFDFANYYLDNEIISILPVSEEILSENRRDRPLFPITYKAADLSPEEYEISARRDGIEIRAINSRGLMYALFTLSELAKLNDGYISEFELRDCPELSFRAVSDDISRRQISTFDNFLLIIRRLARYKYNIYMPYIEDVFKYDCMPSWSRDAHPVSKEEWKAIIAYAKTYHIEIRPIVNLLGHMDKVCRLEKVYPMVLKDKDGRPFSVLDPTNEKVKEIIPKMLSEIVDCFGKGLVHCGGDEPVALSEVFGKEKAAELFIEHYTFISSELKKLNCQMMVYADFFAPPWGDYAVPVDCAKELPAGTSFVFWDYAARDAYPWIDALHKQNLKLFISPGSWTWGRFSCDIKTCYKNTKGLLSADRSRAAGMIMSNWSDGGNTLRELVWPGVIIGANFCWAPKSSYTYEEIYDSYHKSFFDFDHDEAALLEPVYHHDEIINRADQHEFKKEFLRNPSEPVEFKDKESIGVLQAAMKKSRADMASLEPQRNRSTFEALEYTIAGTLFTANKIAALPSNPVYIYEERLKYSHAALCLTGELLALKELHCRLWHYENRESEWKYISDKYDDLYDQLRIFARSMTYREV